MRIFSGWRLKVACRACANRSSQSPRWHTFEATHADFLPYASARLRGMIKKNRGNQSKQVQCQLLRQANHSLAESRHVIHDVCLMYTALKRAPGFPIHVGNRTRYRRMHAVLLLFWQSPNVCIQTFGMWGMYNLAKAYRSINKNAVGMPINPRPPKIHKAQYD